MPEEAEPASQTAGSILKAERQRRGFTEKSVADQLHITMHYVKAIESDSYEKLPGKIFAKGYIKSYAILLQLDENEIIGLYDQFSALKDEAAQEEGRLVAAQHKKDRILPWLVFAIIAFVAGYLCLWAYNRFFETVDASDPNAEVQYNQIRYQATQVLVASGVLAMDNNRNIGIDNSARLVVGL